MDKSIYKPVRFTLGDNLFIGCTVSISKVTDKEDRGDVGIIMVMPLTTGIAAIELAEKQVKDVMIARVGEFI